MKQLNLEQVVLLAPPAMLTTELGVWVATRLCASFAAQLAGLQVIAIFLMNLKQQLQKSRLNTAPTKSCIYQSQGIGMLGVCFRVCLCGGGVVMVPLQMLFQRKYQGCRAH